MRCEECSTHQVCQASSLHQNQPPVGCNRLSSRLELLVSLEQPYREDLPAQRPCHAYAVTPKHIRYTKVAFHIPCATGTHVSGWLWQMYKIIIHHLWKTTTRTVTQSLAEVPVNERYGDGRSDFLYKTIFLMVHGDSYVTLKSVKKKRNCFQYYQSTHWWTCAPLGFYRVWMAYNWTEFIPAFKKSEPASSRVNSSSLSSWFYYEMSASGYSKTETELWDSVGKVGWLNYLWNIIISFLMRKEWSGSQIQVFTSASYYPKNLRI